MITFCGTFVFHVIRGSIRQLWCRVVARTLHALFGIRVNEDPEAIAWFASALAWLFAIIGALTGLRFFISTVVFMARVVMLIRSGSVKEVHLESLSDAELEEEEKKVGLIEKWGPFIKAAAVYIGLIAVSLSSMYGVWRNLKALLRLFEVSLPEWITDAVEGLFPKLDFGVWDFSESWGPNVRVEIPNTTRTVLSLKWDASELAFKHFAENADSKCVAFIYARENVASGKPRIVPSRLGLGHPGGSCSATLSSSVVATEAVFVVKEVDHDDVYFGELTFTFTRDVAVTYAVTRNAWINQQSIQIAVVVLLLSAVFYYYFCFYKASSVIRIMREARVNRVNKSQHKKQRNQAYPADQGPADGGSAPREKPDWQLPEDHPMAREAKEDNKTPEVATEALHTSEKSEEAVQKVKKVKREAKVSSSPTVPSRNVKALCLVHIFDKKTATGYTLSGFAAALQGANNTAKQVIICPATHGIITSKDGEGFDVTVQVATAEGVRKTLATFYQQWAYSVGSIKETGTAFTYTGGGLKMLKTSLTSVLNRDSVTQGMIFSLVNNSVSGGTVRLTSEGLVVHEITTQEGDSGALVWSTVLNEARTAMTVPVAVHFGHAGSNLAIPIAVALKNLNFL